MVCAECGSENVNEERLVSRGINNNVVYNEEVFGYFCRKCEEPVDIVSETAFIEECQIAMREFLKAMPDIEFIEVNGKIVPTIKQSN